MVGKGRQCIPWCEDHTQLRIAIFLFCLQLSAAAQFTVEDNCPFETFKYLHAQYGDAVRVRGEYMYMPTENSFAGSGRDSQDIPGDDDNRRMTHDGLVVTNERRVSCEWFLTASDPDLVSVFLSLTPWREPYDQKSEDCWHVYEFVGAKRSLRERVCNGDGMEWKEIRGSGQGLLLVFLQGSVPGLRSLSFQYMATYAGKSTPKAPPEDSEEPRKRREKTVIVAFSTVLALVAVCFLVLKTTRWLRPCRKRWCPQQCSSGTSTPQGSSEGGEGRDQEEGERGWLEPERGGGEGEEDWATRGGRGDVRLDSLSDPPPPFESLISPSAPPPPPEMENGGGDRGGGGTGDGGVDWERDHAPSSPRNSNRTPPPSYESLFV